jgi:hypothetical protein
MKTSPKTFIISLVLFVLSSTFTQAQDDVLSQLDEIAIIDSKVMMPMRDGIRLATDIYRPKAEGTYPIIFSRTPYNFNTWVDGKRRLREAKRAYDYVKKGYVYVVQNERGRFFLKANGIFWAFH